MEALATEVKTKVMPTVDTAQSMLVEWRPKIDTIASNVSETSTVVRGQVERLDATVTDIVDRTRLQLVERAGFAQPRPWTALKKPAM